MNLYPLDPLPYLTVMIELLLPIRKLKKLRRESE